MKKYISLIFATLFSFVCSLTAFAETVVIAPETTSNPDVKTAVITRGGGFGMWFLIVLAIVVAVFALIIIINKKRDKKTDKNNENDAE